MSLSKGYKNIVNDYKEFCERNMFVESDGSYNLFCGAYLMKDTMINQKRINLLLEYIENK